MIPSALIVAVAALAAGVQGAPAAYCSASPYKAFLVLSKYQPAQQFCAAKYPIPPATVTVTVPAAARMAVRSPVTPAPLVKDAVTQCTGNCAAWSSLSKIGGSIIKSACSCIQTQSTVTSTVTAAPVSPPCQYPRLEIPKLTCGQQTGTNEQTGASVQWLQAPVAYQGANVRANKIPYTVDFGTRQFSDPCAIVGNCIASFSQPPSPSAFSLFYDATLRGWFCRESATTDFTQDECNVQYAYAFARQ